MSIARALEKLGLVELSEREKADLRKENTPPMSKEEIAQLARGQVGAKPGSKKTSASGKGAKAGGSAAAARAKSAKGSAAGAPIDDSRSFEDIYKQAGVPDSPFPADKLMRLLDGLATLTWLFCSEPCTWEMAASAERVASARDSRNFQ